MLDRLLNIRLLMRLVVLLAWHQPCNAQSVVEFGSRLLGGSFGGTNQIQGWEFVAKDNLSVTGLGLFDGNSSGGFVEPHQIGLWDAGGNLLVAASIGPGDNMPLVGNFRFVNVPATSLQAGQTYVVAAFMPAPVSDYTYAFTPESAALYGLRFDPRIEFVAYRESLASTLTFPTGRVTDVIAAFGPNMFVEVPEMPASYLIALGTFLIAFQKIAGRRCVRPRPRDETRNAAYKPAAPNPAIASRFQVRRRWRGSVSQR